MNQRHEFLNFFLKKTRGINYLEIGVEDARQCFFHIRAENKIGVDPKKHPTHRENVFNETSDVFFSKVTSNLDLDVVFVDGLHHWEQVVRDVHNAVNHINDFGIIMLHDCLPLSEEMQGREQCAGAWTGDTWKAVEYLNRYASGFANRFTIAADWGCHVLVVNKKDFVLSVPVSTEEQFKEINALDYQWFLDNYDGMTTLISPEEIEQYYENYIDVRK